MHSKTIGFAMDPKDQERVDRLARRLTQGNRSALLRFALDHLESIDRAERLRKLQAYGARRSAERGKTVADVRATVRRVLRSRRKA